MNQLPAAAGNEVCLSLQTLPSVDRLLGIDALQLAANEHGRALVKRAIGHVLSAARVRLVALPRSTPGSTPASPLFLSQLQEAILAQIGQELMPRMRTVFNLTGTVIHTNLGRSPLPEAAISALVNAARHPVTIEYDLVLGARGERDQITEALICELTGAEAATVVNNTAAAVMLVLSAVAKGKQVPVSRGELVEIGGSFRIPEIMQTAGCQLIEVGTTNRTHLRDYEQALTAQTGLIARIHTSNYAIQGFTAKPSEAELATLAHAHQLPLLVDLGSGALVPFERYGLPHEPLPQESLKAGADLVTFSGDKLLGGPQSGIIIGRKDLIDVLRQHPLKRVLRCDKLIIAALEGVLRTYCNYLDEPEQLARHIPVLRLLSRTEGAIESAGRRLLAPTQRALQHLAQVALCPTQSQVGSGSLPIDRLDSWALVLTPLGKRSGRTVSALEAALRMLPTPVIGRIQDGAVWLDLRALEHEAAFSAQLAHWSPLTTSALTAVPAAST